MLEEMPENINKDVEEYIKKEKQEKKDNLLYYIKIFLYERWERRSRITEVTKQAKFKIWTELLNILYHTKALNKKELYHDINFARKKLIADNMQQENIENNNETKQDDAIKLAFEIDRENNKNLYKD